MRFSPPSPQSWLSAFEKDLSGHITMGAARDPERHPADPSRKLKILPRRGTDCLR